VNHPSSDTRRFLTSEEGPRRNVFPLGLGDIAISIFQKIIRSSSPNFPSSFSEGEKELDER